MYIYVFFPVVIMSESKQTPTQEKEQAQLCSVTGFDSVSPLFLLTFILSLSYFTLL